MRTSVKSSAAASAGGTLASAAALRAIARPAASAPPRTALLRRIEALVADLIRVIALGQDPAAAVGLPPLAGGSFTGARDLAAALKVLRVVYECALSGKTVTQRELYYMGAAHYGSQGEAQAGLARLSSLLGFERHEMGVLAASRGKVAGLVALRAADCGSSSSAASAAGGSGSAAWLDLAARGGHAPISGDCVATPPLLASRGAQVILVVEKDAIFARLVEDRVWEAVPCVLVTGCGMPDMATRAFVRHAATSLRLRVLILVDSNPYGLGILLCYVNGSKADGRRHALRGAPYGVGWLGLCRGDMEHYDLPTEALQALSLADERKAAALLRDPYVEGAGTQLAAAIADEASAFLETREKMELEGLLGRGIGFLANKYLPDKILVRRDWVDDEVVADAPAESGKAAGAR